MGRMGGQTMIFVPRNYNNRRCFVKLRVVGSPDIIS
jgi:hypothetical protein